MESISPSSYWHDGSQPLMDGYPPLVGPLQTDILVIGAGITGLTAAMHLKNAGRRVVVVEAGRVGAGTTGGTSGHLDAHPEQGAQKFIEDFGQAAAWEVTAARLAAIDQIESWCRDSRNECEFRRIPAFFYSESSAGAETLHGECQSMQRLGLVASPVGRLDLPYSNAGGCRIENQGRFHVLRYLSALAARFHGNDCAVYEHTPAQPPEDGQPCTVETRGGIVSANEVLVCTHSPFLGVSQFDMRVAPYQSYVLAVRVSDKLADALYWDDEHPYHYTRIASTTDPGLLLIGGADHKTGQGGDEQESFHRLEQYVRERFSVVAIERRWSSEFFESADGLPYVGRVPFSQHLYLATGFSGTGLTFGTLAGGLLAELILGHASKISKILSPSRFKPMVAGATIVSEGLNAAQHFVTDRFAGEVIDSLEQVAPGEGKLVTYRGSQWAVFRDDQGMVHVRSPVCTHMGCHVRWNEAENSWDCPCHGGRYSALGERIYGPPARDLKTQPLDDL